jgi:hypothetical protein
MIESSPSVDPASIETFWKIVTLFPMITLSPIVVNGPTATFVPSLALGALRHGPGRKPARHDPRNREVRIIDADPPLVFAFQIFRHQNGACLCLGQLRGVFAIAEEAHVLLASFRERSDCCDLAISISNIMAAHEIDDFSERNRWHGSECIGLPARIKATKSSRLELHRRVGGRRQKA